MIRHTIIDRRKGVHRKNPTGKTFNYVVVEGHEALASSAIVGGQRATRIWMVVPIVL